MQSMLDRSDAYGETMIDGFMQGCKYLFSADLQEWDSGMAAFMPFFEFGGGPNPDCPIGARMSDYASAFVMNSTPGTPAEDTPASISVGLAIIAPGQTLSFNLNGVLRELPLVFLALPEGTAGSSGVADTLTYFTVT